jgi:hypothetical protein
VCSFLRQVISGAERENATFIQGSLIDRLAPGGALRRVLPRPHILRQFPVECLVVEQFAGPRQRIIAFKVGNTRCCRTVTQPQTPGNATAVCGGRSQAVCRFICCRRAGSTRVLTQRRSVSMTWHRLCMQGFLRTDDENHHVVLPQHAKAYFSACSEAAAMPPASGIFKDCSGAEGTEPAKLEGHLYLAPYAHFPARSANVFQSLFAVGPHPAQPAWLLS